MDGGSNGVLIDAFDPANFPFVLIEGVDIVIFSKFLVEVIAFEFG